MKAANLLSTVLILLLALTACQNDDGKKSKSRLDASARAKMRYQGKTEAGAGADAENKLTDQGTGADLAALNDQHCREGVEFADLCRAIYVVVREDNSIAGLDKKLLINQNRGLEIGKNAIKVKDNRADFIYKAEAQRKNVKALLLVALTDANSSAREQISDVSVENTTVEVVEIKNGDITPLIQRADTAAKDQQLVTIAVGRELLTRAQEALSGKANVIGFQETQITTVGIENLLLKEYVGDLLYLAFHLPYKRSEVALETLEIKLDGRPLQIGDEKAGTAGPGDDVRVTEENGKLLLKIVNRKAFNKFSDPLSVAFTLKPKN